MTTTNKIIKSVSLIANGDAYPIWYCKECELSKSDQEPPSGTVWGNSYGRTICNSQEYYLISCSGNIW